MLSSVLCFTACNIFGEESGKTLNQEWMPSNLNVSTFRNGGAIPEAKTQEEWIKAGKEGKPAWSYYDNDPKNDAKYGKLYNWYAVNDPRGLAPSGWHVPSNAEWTKLIDYLGGENAAGGKMKSEEFYNYLAGNNDSGFRGLPGGCRVPDGNFYSFKENGYWWSSTQGKATVDNGAWLIILNDDIYDVGREDWPKDYGFSVRCLKD